MTFGELLKDLRMKRGYSLRELAKRTGVDSAYLSRVERGVCKPPQKENIIWDIIGKVGTKNNPSQAEKEFCLLCDLSLVENSKMPELQTQSYLIPVILRTIDGKKMSEEKLLKLTEFINRKY